MPLKNQPNNFETYQCQLMVNLKRVVILDEVSKRLVILQALWVIVLHVFARFVNFDYKFEIIQGVKNINLYDKVIFNE